MRDMLRKSRQNRGWSIRDTAEKTGITKSQYHNIELGRANPNPEEAKVICDILNLEFGSAFPEMIQIYQKEVEIRSVLVSGIHPNAM